MVSTWGRSTDATADAREWTDRMVNSSWLRVRPDDARAYGLLPEALLQSVRIPYALRRVLPTSYARLVAPPAVPQPGDIVLAGLEKVGKNARLELANGRPCALHVGDLLAVVFGNRYATMQFEGYARTRGDSCDLLSMGGLCGVVESKHDGVTESTKLRLLGAFADPDGRPSRLGDFRLPLPELEAQWPHVVVVCGTSMDAGKTYTATSLIQGLRRHKVRVAGIKLTGTAAGRDTWSMLDAGSCAAFDFVDGGFPSTYRAGLDELLELERLLVSHAACQGAEWVVMEIADGLLQDETSALLTSDEFRDRIAAYVFAAGDAMSAAAGIRLLREWKLDPIGVSGKVTMSPLAMREAESATGVPCFTARDLQAGALTSRLIAAARQGVPSTRPRPPHERES